MTRHLTCIYRFGFDKLSTLSQSGFKPLKRARKGKLAWLLAIGTALCLAAWMPKEIVKIPVITKKPVLTKKIDYQIYALQQLQNITQFDCLVTLWDRESQWSTVSENGDHYGIPQGKSHWLKGKPAYAQILWGIKYIGYRYGYAGNTPNVCAALAHSYAHWWY
jgi:hypothetical protein